MPGKWIMMVEYGMKPLNVLQSATSVNADVFKISDKVGQNKSRAYMPIFLLLQGDPSKNIHDIRNVKLVMKNGVDVCSIIKVYASLFYGTPTVFFIPVKIVLQTRLKKDF